MSPAVNTANKRDGLALLHVRLPPDLADAVRRQAGAEERSINAIVKRALRAYLAGSRP